MGNTKIMDTRVKDDVASKNQRGNNFVITMCIIVIIQIMLLLI